jgi:hypothetical protein
MVNVDTRGGRRTGDLPEAAGAVGQPDDPGARASDISVQVQSALNRQE